MCLMLAKGKQQVERNRKAMAQAQQQMSYWEAEYE